MLKKIVDVAVEIDHDPDQRTGAGTDGERNKQATEEITEENLHERTAYHM
jgi:hypothetical protein